MINSQDILKRERDRAISKATDGQSFIIRNFWMWVVIAYVVYPAAAIFSALTEGGHILIRAQAALGEGNAAWAVTALLVLMIETLKFFLGKGTVDDIQANPFSQGGATLSMFVLKAIGFAGIMFLSVNLSVTGAGLINETIRKHSRPVTSEAGYVDESGIISRYDAELKPHRDNIREYQGIRWKGTITVAAQRMIRAEQAQIDKIIAARDIELARVRTENDQLKSDWVATTEDNSSYAMGFAGIGEAIALLALIFIGIYDDGIKREAVKGTATVVAPPLYNPSDYGSAALLAAATKPEKRQIGFHRAPDIRMHPPVPVVEPVAPVATGSNTSNIDLAVEDLIAAYKYHKKNYDAWASKLRTGAGNESTNRKRAEEAQNRVDVLRERIKALGVEI
jgi:hypothetical protein